MIDRVKTRHVIRLQRKIHNKMYGGTIHKMDGVRYNCYSGETVVCRITSFVANLPAMARAKKTSIRQQIRRPVTVLYATYVSAKKQIRNNWHLLVIYPVPKNPIVTNRYDLTDKYPICYAVTVGNSYYSTTHSKIGEYRRYCSVYFFLGRLGRSGRIDHFAEWFEMGRR